MFGARYGVYSNPVYATTRGIYSVRSVGGYSGPVMRVRRSSDNTEQDIGTSGGNLDTVSLLAFVGAGNGFVRTWYDQSGQANHVTQTTLASQPQIVAAGVVILNGAGLPHIDFVNKFMVLTVSGGVVFGIGKTTTQMTFYCAARRTSASAVQASSVCSIQASTGFSSSNQFAYDTCYSGTNGILSACSQASLLSTTFASILNTDVVHTVRWRTSDGARQIRNNSVQVGSDSLATQLTPVDFFRIGGQFSPGTQIWGGRLGELRIYATYHDDTTRNAIETDMQAYF